MNYLLRTWHCWRAGVPADRPWSELSGCRRYFPGTRLHGGFILALLACIGICVLLYKTPLDSPFDSRWPGPDAAVIGGHQLQDASRRRLFSGALAALGGFVEVNGAQHMLVQGFNP